MTKNKKRSKKAATPPPPKKKAKGPVEFGIRPGAVFAAGFRGYAANLVPLTLAGLIVLATYAAFRYPSQQFLDDDRVWAARFTDLAGLFIAGTLAYPWYRYALAAADGDKVNIAAPFATPRRFGYQAAASFWFFAAVVLGQQYLGGLPAILAALLYAFYGYVVAENDNGGLKALGTSVRLGERRRIGLFAIGGMLFVFNILGASGLAAGLNPLGYSLAVVGLSVTTSITLVSGAAIYRVLQEKLNE